jgi:hypothetical protein
MNEPDRQNGPADSDELTGQLRALGALLDRQRYPGRAWRPQRTPLLWRVGVPAALAAAAAVLLAVAWTLVVPEPGPTGDGPVAHDPADGSAGLADGALAWAVPTDLNLPAPSEVDLEIPPARGLELPAVSDALVGLSADWTFELPEIALPAVGGEDGLDVVLPPASLILEELEGTPSAS